ncbi:MAG: DHH family phosphoesterase [Desulfobacterales bacterium]|nr:DHH family phosphoesterase [Desulfobacterales bacterium]MBF0395301.1 DHH family phosphoesterase [Desulfobacterales bacterium]
MACPKLEKLNQFYEQFSGNDSVLIVINADPDAIASAIAVKRLLWRKVISVTISNINILTRPDNLAMIRILGIKMIYFKDIDISQYNRFIIVDSQPDHNEKFKYIVPSVIIDHHPEKSVLNAPFIDIRSNYGACSTILTEYLIAAKIKPSVRLATALFYAIKVDTNNFERKALLKDIKAFQFLFSFANINLSRQIEHEDLKIDFLKYFKIALNDSYLKKSKVFIHIGEVTNPDICVIIADFFMRVNTINWSVVSGICDGKLVIIFRNDKLIKNAGNLAKRAFSSIGSAGGHINMARAEIPISKIETEVNTKDNKKVLKWIISKIEKN